MKILRLSSGHFRLDGIIRVIKITIGAAKSIIRVIITKEY